jgi:DNA-binding response OmpR family regulator
MRVLFADSDELFLEIVQAYFLKCGHTMMTASDGLECCAVLRDFQPDAIVLDCEILWCEGVMGKLGSDPVLSHIPTILVADDESIKNSLIDSKLQCVAWLRKPYGLECLLEKLEFVIGAERTAEQK